VHFEDQLSSEKKCGHLGGKVLVPTRQFVRTLVAARLAADVLDVPTVLIARTDALAATLLTSDVDPRDRAFCDGERTDEGFFRVRDGLDPAIARALAYAPYCDLLWCETSTPDLEQAQRFAAAVHAEHPDKPLAYNCSPSFNWRRHLDDERSRRSAGAADGQFQFITLAGYHALNAGMFELAKGFSTAAGMRLQSGSRAGARHTRLQRQRRREPDGSTWCPAPSAARRRSRSGSTSRAALT
jgi:isocitrate lyase